ncbi:MAG TPA: SLC13 family permease [Chloroflexaceae bacterium]|nr:SLC13 family permease [Chloroflexaceae bacterium]
MTPETLIVFGILAATVALFLSDRLRLDVVALLALLALTLSGILTPAEALAGFGDPLVLTIAGLFVVGAAIFQTGVGDALGRRLTSIAGTSEPRAIAATMLLVALLSTVMSSTGTVAVFLPVVTALARSTGLSRARLLIPLAYAALLGGMVTLIASPPNLVASEALRAAGYEPFGFFSFTPSGLIMVLLGVGYMALLGRRLLPAHDHEAPAVARVEDAADLVARYQLPGQLFRLRVRSGSPLAGRTLADNNLRAEARLNVVAIQRAHAGQVAPPDPGAMVGVGDVLTVKGTSEDVQRAAQTLVLGVQPESTQDGEELAGELGVAEVLLTPRSRLLGHSLRAARFRDLYQVIVLAILRHGEPVAGPTSQATLRFGDTLLVQGTWAQIAGLRAERNDFVVLGEPRGHEGVRYDPRRGALVIAIMLAMLALITFELLPTATAVLLAAVAIVLTGCLTMEDAYRAMSWESVVLIAGMLPMATALEKTGGMELLAGGLTASLGPLGPLAVLAGLFMLTSLFGLFISNTATAVLMAPIALQAAAALAVSPYPMLMTVAIAASTAFATPIASPVNTLVVGPGGYRFRDFVVVGMPLQLLLLAASVLAIPLLFPFAP